MDFKDHIHTHTIPSPPPPPQPSVVLSPCAACKILRRRCVDKCVLAPYFPPNEPFKFTIAHRVFGASNIIKFLQVSPHSPSLLCVGPFLMVKKSVLIVKYQLYLLTFINDYLRIKSGLKHTPCFWIDRSYRSRSERTRWAAWCTKRTPGSETPCTVVRGRSAIYKSKWASYKHS